MAAQDVEKQLAVRADRSGKQHDRGDRRISRRDRGRCDAALAHPDERDPLAIDVAARAQEGDRGRDVRSIAGMVSMNWPVDRPSPRLS
jgi:hypothetical protein